MEISIYYMYLFFANLTKCSKPSWSGKRTLAKGFRFLFSLPRGSGLCLLMLGLGWKKREKKKKKNAFKKDKVKKTALFFSLSLFPALPPVCPQSPPAVEVQKPFSRVEPLGRVRSPGDFQTASVARALCSPRRKIRPTRSVWLPIGGRPQTRQGPRSSRTRPAIPAGCPLPRPPTWLREPPDLVVPRGRKIRDRRRVCVIRKAPRHGTSSQVPQGGKYGKTARGRWSEMRWKTCCRGALCFQAR